jgi:NADH dehydrogenase
MEIWAGMVVGMPALHGQPVTVIGEGTRKHSFVSMGDVGEYAVAAVDHPEARNTTLVIGGPEPLSFRDCAAVYGELLGREIPVRGVAPGEPVPGLPGPMLGMLAGFDMYDSPIDMTQTSSTFGVTPTPLREAVRRQLASNPGPPQA